MSTAPKFTRGEIVEVDLAGALGAEKQNDAYSNTRPCVVVQNDKGNEVYPLLTVAPMTTQDLDLVFPINARVTEADGAEKTCNVECGQIRAVDRSRVKATGRHLSADAMARVDKALKVQLGLR